jgi:hypothetical protein
MPIDSIALFSDAIEISDKMKNNRLLSSVRANAAFVVFREAKNNKD